MPQLVSLSIDSTSSGMPAIDTSVWGGAGRREARPPPPVLKALLKIDLLRSVQFRSPFRFDFLREMMEGVLLPTSHPTEEIRGN